MATEQPNNSFHLIHIARFLLPLCLGGLLKETEDNEFCRPDYCDADLADEMAVQYVLLRHGGAIAADEERFLLGSPEQRTVAP
jgi:hypothetical protein